MPQYRKKPVVVHAFQWDGSRKEAATIAKWVEVRAGRGVAMHDESPDDSGDSLSISTLEGIMKVSPGDWVIKGVEGEFYPCRDSIFKATYDEDSEYGDPEAAEDND